MEKRFDRYCDLMEEVKRRFAVVEAFLAHKNSAVYTGATIESMALQVRMILELIALGSLAAHVLEYSRQYEKFASHWNAKRIIADLEKVNPDFYPVPIREVPGIGNEPVRLENIEEGYLTQEDFVKAYNECSAILHAKNPYGVPAEYNEYLTKIPLWLDQMRILLHTHQIRLLNQDGFLLVHMEEADNKARAYEFVREG